MTDQRSAAQRGSATVLASFVVCAVLVLGLVAGWWAGAVSLRHRAASAADLAALAGAQAWVGGGSPCPAAQQLARANGGEVVSCRVQGATVQVVVQAVTRMHVLGQAWTLTSQRNARAGPVDGPLG